MEPDPNHQVVGESEDEFAAVPRQDFVLCLYVAGSTPKSVRAIENIRRICEEQIPAGSYALEVVDIYQHPEAASEEQIIAVPTLVKHLPLPLRKIIGDLSNDGYVLRGLGVTPKSST